MLEDIFLRATRVVICTKELQLSHFTGAFILNVQKPVVNVSFRSHLSLRLSSRLVYRMCAILRDFEENFVNCVNQSLRSTSSISTVRTSAFLISPFHLVLGSHDNLC